MQGKRWLKIMCNLDLYIAAIALIILTLVTSSGAFMRYVLRTPLLWQEEVQAFCQVWMVFLGGSVAFRLGSHVAIEMVVDILPANIQRLVSYLIDIIVLFVLLYLCVNSQAYIIKVFGISGRPTPILRIPYSLLYGVAPYGCVLMIISYFTSKYAPRFIKHIEVGISSENDDVREAQNK